MANLATSGVTVVAVYEGFGNNSKRYVIKELSLVLTAMGTAANKIQASVLGFSKIYGSTSASLDDDSTVYPTRPNAAGTQLLIGGGASNVPLDVTGTLLVTVWGLTQI